MIMLKSNELILKRYFPAMFTTYGIINSTIIDCVIKKFWLLSCWFMIRKTNNTTRN